MIYTENRKTWYKHLPISLAGRRFVRTVLNMGFTTDFRTPKPMAKYNCQFMAAKPFIKLQPVWESNAYMVTVNNCNLKTFNGTSEQYLNATEQPYAEELVFIR